MAVTIGLMLIMAEVVLRFLPVATALPVEPPTDANPIERYAANQPYTWLFDWNMHHVNRGRSNAQGFLADYDYDAADPRPLVAVVGDSYIEALLVPFAESLTGRLQGALGNRGRAYAFAQSGSPLSQYLAYARHVCAAYRPARLVVTWSAMISTRASSPTCAAMASSIFIRSPTADLTIGLRRCRSVGCSRVWRATARWRSTCSAMSASPMCWTGWGSIWRWPIGQCLRTSDTPTRPHPVRVAESNRVIDWFLGALPQAACLPASDIILVVDAPRPELYDAAALARVQPSYFVLMRNRIIAEGKARGFKVIDMQPYFIAAYGSDGQRFEHPTDGHWNAHGHEVATAAVLEALAGWLPLAAKEGQ